MPRCMSRFPNGSEARYALSMPKRKWTAVILAGSYILLEWVFRPIWNLNVERIAEHGKFDTTLVEGVPVLEWIGRFLAFLPQSFLAGFVTGAVVFAFWDTWWGWLSRSKKEPAIPADPAPTPTPAATPEPTPPGMEDERIFIPKDVHLDELSILYETHTWLEASQLTQKYIGKWTETVGILDDLSEIRCELYVHLQYMVIRKTYGLEVPIQHDIWATFGRPRDIERLRLAKKGHAVRLVGRLHKISDMRIEFEDCELVWIKTVAELEKEQTKGEAQKSQSPPDTAQGTPT